MPQRNLLRASTEWNAFYCSQIHKHSRSKGSAQVSGESIFGCREQQPPAILLPEPDACTSGQSQAAAQYQCELKFDLLGWMHMFGTELVNHMWGLCGWRRAELKGTLTEWASAEIERNPRELACMNECFKFFSSDLRWILFHRRCQGQYGEEDLNAGSLFNLLLWFSFKNVKNWNSASRRELKLRTVESLM